MKKTVLIYGLVGGVLIALLKLVEYRFLVIEHSLEIYGGIVALLFSGRRIWLGLKPARTCEVVHGERIGCSSPFRALLSPPGGTARRPR